MPATDEQHIFSTKLFLNGLPENTSGLGYSTMMGHLLLKWQRNVGLGTHMMPKSNIAPFSIKHVGSLMKFLAYQPEMESSRKPAADPAGYHLELGDGLLSVNWPTSWA